MTMPPCLCEEEVVVSLEGMVLQCLELQVDLISLTLNPELENKYIHNIIVNIYIVDKDMLVFYTAGKK